MIKKLKDECITVKGEGEKNNDSNTVSKIKVYLLATHFKPNQKLVKRDTFLVCF